LVVVAAVAALAFAACGGLLETPVSGVTLSESTTTIAVGHTDQLTATVAPAGATNKAVTWTSSDATKATVDEDGLVTGVAVGTATVTVTADGGHAATCEVTVEAATVAVTGVTLDRTTASISVGNTTQLTAKIAPADATDQDVTWASNDETKATVSATGLVTGVASGSATITATTVDGAKTATCTASVVSVYAAGFSTESTGLEVAGYWQDGVWQSLTPAEAERNAQVTSLAVNGGHVYAAGYSKVTTNNIPRAGAWIDGIWVASPVADPAYDSEDTSVFVSGNDVYTAGWAKDSGSTQWGGYSKNSWVGGALVSVASGPVDTPWPQGSAVNSIFVAADVIYAGGSGYDVANSAVVAGYWTISAPSAGTWTELTPPAGARTKNSAVKSLVVSGSDIYAAGYITTDANGRIPGYWKIDTVRALTTWQDLTPLDSAKQSEVDTIFVTDTDVYAGGFSTAADNSVVPGYWKNGTWTALPCQAATPLGRVSSLVVVGSDVYAGGGQVDSLAMTLAVAGYWANGVWVALPALDAAKSAAVTSLVVIP
jgi:hypothetical protein